MPLSDTLKLGVFGDEGKQASCSQSNSFLGVGKTCLITQLTEKGFLKSYRPTGGADILSTSFTKEDSQTVIPVQIFDIVSVGFSEF